MKAMRHYVATILLLTLACFCRLDAQLLRGYGLKAGLTSANEAYHLGSLPQFETKRRVGFCIAAYAEWLNLSALSVVTQLEYTQRGVGWELKTLRVGPRGFEQISSQVSYARVDFISLPILIKLRLPVGSIQPFLLAGPRIDHLLGYTSADWSLIDPYSSFDQNVLGGSVGGGVESVELLPVDVVMEFRYNHDFVNSYENPVLTVRKNAFDFWLGVRL